VGAGCDDAWRRKGGLAGAPTQARRRRVVRHAGTGERGPAQMGRCGVVGRRLAIVGRSGEIGKWARPKKHNVVFIITQKNPKELN
jgi:hypothetical protein